MKKIFTSLLCICFLFLSVHVTAQRYVDEVFTDVTTVLDQPYGANVGVITGAPVLDTLLADYYMPMGDTVDTRPLVVVLHTGSFLPRVQNGTTTGYKDDYTVTEICTRLAKQGYVAAAIEYRLGWNPLDTSEISRRTQLIQAAYRGVQDTRMFIRSARKAHAEAANPYGIDPSKIAVIGQGTGGYISLATASLDVQNEIYINKFTNPITGMPMVDTLIMGDIYGVKAGAINVPNHVGYSSDFSFAMNLGGALGDSSWIDENSVPSAGAHVVTDPFAPFGYDPIFGGVSCEGPVIVPTTGEFVVNVAGTKCVINQLNANGANDVINDNYTAIASDINDAIRSQPLAEDNLWAIAPTIPATPQSGPWDFWSEAVYSQIPHPLCGALPITECNFHTINSQTNPDMSLEKANAYIDTVLHMFSTRANLIMNTLNTDVEDVINDISVKFAPNPSSDVIYINSPEEQILGIKVYSLDGSLVSAQRNIQTNMAEIRKAHLTSGIYIAKLQYERGIVTEKIVFD